MASILLVRCRTVRGKSMNNILPKSEFPKNPSEIIKLHLDGLLEEAHDAYVNYFQEHDIDYNLLNMFAVCCVNIGKLEKAEKLFEAIIEHAPEITEAYIHLAEVLTATDRVAAAVDLLSLQQVESLDDHKIELMRCELLCKVGRHSDAAKSLRQLCLEMPKDVDLKLKLAEIEVLLKNINEAKKLIDQVIFDRPNDLQAKELQAVALASEEKWDAALATITLVADALPRNIPARLLKCKALQEKGEKELHLEEAENLAEIDPENPEILATLMQAQSALKLHPISIYTASKLLGIKPKNLEALGVLSAGYFGTSQYEKALGVLEKTLKMIPNDANSLSSRGVCLERLFRVEEALSAFDKAMANDPHNPVFRFNKSLCLLALGEFKEGFELYENRLESERLTLSNYIGDEPEWTGAQSLKDRHILVHPEQGFGDTIMAARFVQQLNDDGARITLAVPKSLESVMRTLNADCNIVTVGENIGNIDFHSSLMSLAYHTRDRWNRLPAPDQYLSVPERERQLWSKKFEGRKAFRVGIVCSGNPNHQNDLNRSLNMVELRNALPEGPEYHVLQRDLRPTDELAIDLNDDVIDHSNDIETFADTAALCDLMDLVISVDTSVAHLAGALGCKLIVLVPQCGDWRWGTHKTRSDWYPKAMVLRQPRLGDWTLPFESLNLLISNEISHFKN